jgi:hypothetical protein
MKMSFEKNLLILAIAMSPALYAQVPNESEVHITFTENINPEGDSNRYLLEVEGPHTPTPRLPDGTVDLGGNGVWNLPWVSNMANAQDKPKAPPWKPWVEEMWKYNGATDHKYDPEGFCLPPGGPRSMATPYPAEIVQDNDRILIVFEGGGHVWREIHMDGREHPKDVNPTYFGHSVGRWEGDTLVIDTIGYNEKSWLDYSGTMHTDQLHTIEYITRPIKEKMHYKVTIDDPGAFNAPWDAEWDILWNEGQELQDYVCQENNKFMIDLHDDLGQPFFEKTER